MGRDLNRSTQQLCRPRITIVALKEYLRLLNSQWMPGGSDLLEKVASLPSATKRE